MSQTENVIKLNRILKNCGKITKSVTRILMIWGGADVIIIGINVNVKPLNHPETIPHPWSMEKVSSKKPVPGAKKVGNLWLKDLPISYRRNTAKIKRQSSWNLRDRVIHFFKKSYLIIPLRAEVTS